MDKYETLITFTIDENLRTISVPTKGSIFGVVGDIEVNRVKFDLPRYYNGFDMTEFTARVNYVNSNGDMNYYEADDLTGTEERASFTWLMEQIVTAYIGDVKFSVKMYRRRTNEKLKQFNTKYATGRVVDGFDVEQYITPEEQVSLLNKIESDIRIDLNEYINQKKTDIDDFVNDTMDKAISEINKDENVKQISKNSKDISLLKEDLMQLSEEIEKPIEPNRTTFFDFTEEEHKSVNIFNVDDKSVSANGVTVAITDNKIECSGTWLLSYNSSIDTGLAITLPKGEYDVSAWNGSGQFDVDLVCGDTKRVNCLGATHTTISLTEDTTYSLKIRCTPNFVAGSCDVMIVTGKSKPSAYERYFEPYVTLTSANVKKSVLPMYQKFCGKRIATIGDSIMHGDGNGGYGIGDILAERNDMILSDYSEGGATISLRPDKASASDEWSKGQNIQYQVSKMLTEMTEKPCVVLINGQTNDINYVSGSEEPQQQLGAITTSYTSFSSNETFCGGLEKIFSDIKKTWSDVPIIYIRVHKMMSRKVDWQESYGEKAIQICKKWSVKPVDIYTEGGLNTLISEHKIYTGNDGDYTHPNRQGYDIFYIPMIENAMMELLN